MLNYFYYYYYCITFALKSSEIVPNITNFLLILLIFLFRKYVFPTRKINNREQWTKKCVPRHSNSASRAAEIVPIPSASLTFHGGCNTSFRSWSHQRHTFPGSAHYELVIEHPRNCFVTLSWLFPEQPRGADSFHPLSLHRLSFSSLALYSIFKICKKRKIRI